MAVKKSSKIVKKRWVKLVAPTVLREAAIGETFISDPEIMIGKKMNIGLGTITGEPQKQHTHVNLIIRSFEDGIYKTDLRGYRILPAAVKKMVRRNKSRIDDSFVIMTKDKQFVRIKPIAITRNKAQCSVQTAIRKKIRLELAKLFTLKDFSTLVSEFLGRRLQAGIARSLSKIFPVGIFEIRQLTIIDAEKAKKMNIIRFVAEQKPENKSSPQEAKEPVKGPEQESKK